MDIVNNASLLPLSTNDVAAAKKPSKLHDAAQQFEALMIGEMMKSVRDTDSEGWLGSGGGTGDDTAMDMAQSQFARALAQGGGLGIAATIEKRMTAQRPDLQNDSAVRESVSAGSEK